MKGLALLFKFMTRLPVPGGNHFDSKALGKSMKWFPVVGMAIGTINFLLAYALKGVVPSPLLMSIILVTAEVIITGGLHLDGLADTFDGIFSYRSRQKMLEIMKDSRVGTNGVLVLILYFIFKIAFLMEASQSLGVSQGAIMFVVPVISRLNSVLNCAFEPYARAAGMGKTFVDNTKGLDFVASYVLVAAFLAGASKYLGMEGITLIGAMNTVIAGGFFFGKLITKKIGGITGDTLGALLELSSVLTLILIYIL